MLSCEMEKMCELYRDDRIQVDENSAELTLLRLLGENRPEEAAALFKDQCQFGGKTVVDAPHGRFEGKECIEAFCQAWLDSFQAQGCELYPFSQTQSGGRSVTELIASFSIKAGGKLEIPMIAVGDLRSGGLLDGFRLYFHFKYAPGFSAYRRPVFPPRHQEANDSHLLTGSVKAYLDALHHFPHADVEAIMATIGPKIAFGGYAPTDTHPLVTDRGALESEYRKMAAYIPERVQIRFETLIDDGVTCVIEWVNIISQKGLEYGRIPQSGIASYVRDREGTLQAIRICDHAGYERDIDWDAVRSASLNGKG